MKLYVALIFLLGSSTKSSEPLKEPIVTVNKQPSLQTDSLCVGALQTKFLPSSCYDRDTSCYKYFPYSTQSTIATMESVNLFTDFCIPCAYFNNKTTSVETDESEAITIACACTPVSTAAVVGALAIGIPTTLTAATCDTISIPYKYFKKSHTKN